MRWGHSVLPLETVLWVNYSPEGSRALHSSSPYPHYRYQAPGAVQINLLSPSPVISLGAWSLSASRPVRSMATSLLLLLHRTWELWSANDVSIYSLQFSLQPEESLWRLQRAGIWAWKWELKAFPTWVPFEATLSGFCLVWGGQWRGWARGGGWAVERGLPLLPSLCLLSSVSPLPAGLPSWKGSSVFLIQVLHLFFEVLFDGVSPSSVLEKQRFSWLNHPYFTQGNKCFN